MEPQMNADEHRYRQSNGPICVHPRSSVVAISCSLWRDDLQKESPIAGAVEAGRTELEGGTRSQIGLRTPRPSAGNDDGSGSGQVIHEKKIQRSVTPSLAQ